MLNQLNYFKRLWFLRRICYISPCQSSNFNFEATDDLNRCNNCRNWCLSCFFSKLNESLSFREKVKKSFKFKLVEVNLLGQTLFFSNENYHSQQWVASNAEDTFLFARRLIFVSFFAFLETTMRFSLISNLLQLPVKGPQI